MPTVHPAVLGIPVRTFEPADDVTLYQGGPLEVENDAGVEELFRRVPPTPGKVAVGPEVSQPTESDLPFKSNVAPGLNTKSFAFDDDAVEEAIGRLNR